MEKINYKDKEIYIIPTAHVSKQSVYDVKEAIENLNPDSVCIELDKGRYESITNPNKWLETDIFNIIKTKRVGFLIANLILSNYQKKIASKFEIKPGQEMIQAIESANQIKADIILVDRDIQTTFTRIYRNHSFLKKIKLIFNIIFMAFTDEDVDEKEIEDLKQLESLDKTLSSISKEYPEIAKVLVKERDQVLAYKIKNAPGNKIVAVLGAAHVPGVLKEVNLNQDIEKLESVPKKSKIGLVLGLLFILILSLLIIFTYIKNPQSGINQILSWILWNGGLSALGVLLARGHILSILVAFIMAPITSLVPFLASGWFAGLTEAYIKKPKVKDFESLSEDISSLKGIYKNRICRILLVVILANLFSSIGTLVSGLDILKIFFNNL